MDLWNDMSELFRRKSGGLLRRCPWTALVTAIALSGLVVIAPSTAEEVLGECDGVLTGEELRVPSLATQSTAAAVSLTYMIWEPRVVERGVTEEVVMTAVIDGAPSAVEFEPASGGPNIPLTSAGSNAYTLTLNANQVLEGYETGDLHSVAGFLRLYEDGALSRRTNLLVNVIDETVPRIQAEPIDTWIQFTPHLVNLQFDTPWTGGIASFLDDVSRTFYSLFDDDLDFLAIVGNVTPVANRFYLWIRNDIGGIGIPLLDRGPTYGSSERLQGVLAFPISQFYDLAEKGAIHEIGHRWANFLSEIPVLSLGVPHWPLSDVAHGIMGITLATGAGGDFPYIIEETPDGFVAEYVGPAREFNDLELYLMGLVPPEAVSQHFVFLNQDQQVGNLEGPVEYIDADTLIAAVGPRDPGLEAAQRHFRVGTMILSIGGLLSDAEMSFFEHMAARGESTEELHFTSGLISGITRPFYLATGERAAISTHVPCLRVANEDVDEDGALDCRDNCPAAANTGQEDGDRDGLGDACDNCPAVFNFAQRDGDMDGVGSICDNCPKSSNPFQSDADGDGVGNLCDSCPQDSDPEQIDSDLDGVGDSCDCRRLNPDIRPPAEVGEVLVDSQGSGQLALSWAPVAGADAYAVIRGDVSALLEGSYGTCVIEEQTVTTFEDSDLPAPGGVFVYMVHGRSTRCGLGTLGFASNEEERINLDPNSC